MNDKPARYSGKKMIAAYVTPLVEEQFARTAKNRRMTKAGLLSRMILHIIGQVGPGETSDSYPDDKKKTYAVTAHLTEGEGMRLIAEADRHEMRVSPFVNMILRGAVAQTISLSVAEQDEMRKISSALAKIGTNLNQAVKLMRSNPYGNNQVTPEMLSDLKKEIDASREVIKSTLQSNLVSWANLNREGS